MKPAAINKDLPKVQPKPETPPNKEESSCLPSMQESGDSEMEVPVVGDFAMIDNTEPVDVDGGQKQKMDPYAIMNQVAGKAGFAV